MNTIPNLHVFKITYLGMTRTLPGRIKITSERFEQSIIEPAESLSYGYNWQVHEKAAYILKEKGFNIVAIGTGWACMYVISDTFEPLFEKLHNHHFFTDNTKS